MGAVDFRNFARTSMLHMHLDGMTYGELAQTVERLEPLIAEAAAKNPDTSAKRTAFAKFMTADPLSDTDSMTLTSEFYDAVGQFAENGALTLIPRSVGVVLATHVITHVDLTGLSPSATDAYRDISRAICAGQHRRARQLMLDFKQHLHEEVRLRWVGRLDEVVERS